MAPGRDFCNLVGLSIEGFWLAKFNDLVIQAVTLLGWLSDILEKLRYLQLGDEKGTLNQPGGVFYGGNSAGLQVIT